MGSTWRAFLVQGALHAGLLCAAATVGAQAIIDCGQGCAPRAFACGGQFTGELSPGDCKEGGRFVDLWTWDATSPLEVEVRIEAVGFTPRLLLLVKPEGFPCTTIAESAACEPATPGAACLRTKVFGSTFLAVTSEQDRETGSYTPLDQLCERDDSGAFFCDLAPGSYLRDVRTSRNVILQQGPQPYTIEVVTSACGQFGDQLPGDCNQDGKLDLADGVCLLSHLFRGEPSVLSCEAGGLGLAGRSLLDWNGHRELNLTDPIALLVHLFQSGVPHVLGSECVPGAGCPRTCGG